MSTDPLPLDAFISYSRRDRAFAERLEAALKAYRPPRELAVAQRHLAVFRDESDIEAGDYDEVIGRHLAQSRRLVVVCSPAARASKYVDDEIARYVRLHGAQAVVPVLIDGLANNEAAPDQHDRMAFPGALVAAMQMPLAVSWRGFDPKRDKVDRGAFEGPWYQLLAHLYGVSRAEIEQRDKRRQQRRRRIAWSVTGAVVATLCAALVLTVLARNEAVRQRDLAEQRRLATQARQLNVEAAAALALDGEGVQRGLLLSLESLASHWTVEAQAALLRHLDRLAPRGRRIDGPHRAPVVALAADAQGRWIASESADLLLVREADTLREVHRAERLGGNSSLRAVTFSPDGRWLAAGCTERAGCVWDTATWRSVLTLGEGGQVLRAAAFDADSRRLAAVVPGRTPVQLYATDGWRALPLPPADDIAGRMVDGLGFVASYRLVLKVADKVLWWDLDPPARLDASPGHAGWAFAYAGTTLVTQDGERRLRVHEVDYGSVLPELIEQPGPWQRRVAERAPLVFLDWAGWPALAAIDVDGMAVVWPRAGPRDPLHLAGGISLGAGPGGLLVGRPDGRIEITALDRPETLRLDRPDAVQALALAPDGGRVALRDAAGRVAVFDTVQGQRLAGFESVPGEGTLAFSRDGRWLVLAGPRELRVHDAADGRERLRHAAGQAFGPVGWSADGRWLLAVSDRQLLRFGVEGWQALAPIAPAEGITAVRLSTDGHAVATTGYSDIARGVGLRQPSITRVWELATGRALAWQSHEAEDLARIGSGVTWARRASGATGEWTSRTAGGDAALAGQAAGWPMLHTLDESHAAPQRPWLQTRDAHGVTLAQRAAERAARAHGKAPSALAFSADGRRLASTGEDRSVRLWPLTADDLVADACRRLLRNLSAEEWQRALGDLPYRSGCAGLPGPTPLPGAR
ncbi:TIR domain-containing protein [Piscinibacter defluvii]|uniref:TIR domain-containing protein n=1 Tax=Piscinibacter defluvii TaxID=1796922 RepID=UPI000FDEA8FD|nr:TIR domain-containing protein [Piscinibacter defluvii]